MNTYTPALSPKRALARAHLPEVIGMPGMVTRTQFWDAVGAASSAIGDDFFYDGLLDVAGALVENDLLALVRYSTFSAPDFIIPRHNRADVEVPYNSGLFAYDPFHCYWRQYAKPAVRSLSQVADPSIGYSTCTREFLRSVPIGDEVAMFLAPLGGTSPTLILCRSKGEFSTSELALLESTFPLVTGLHEAHITAILGQGGGSQITETPRRLVDRTGEELVTNLAWKRLAADGESGLSDASASLTVVAPAHIILPGGRRLVRYSLAADFGAAPGGLYDVVIEPAPHPCATLPGSWLTPLTKREREIVTLTLEGHPISSIAQRLGVGRGTVKNHRMRLYQKLDITTERELFLAHISDLHVTAGNVNRTPHVVKHVPLASNNVKATGFGCRL